MASTTTPTPEFRLLFVCTGNVCRSPLAELLARRLLVEEFGAATAARFAVSSAGVRALVGSPMFPLARAEADRLGLSGAHPVARQLDHRVVRGVDLVLGASPEHRSAVLEDFPELVTRAFTLREFARLAAAVPPAELPAELLPRAHALVQRAHRRRGRIPPGDDRIPDPVGASAEVYGASAEVHGASAEVHGAPAAAYRLAADLIEDSLRTVLGVLRAD